MRFKFENLKNYALLYIATCAFALLGSPLYCRADFIMQQQLEFKAEIPYYKNLSLELLTGYDTEGNFHVEQWKDIESYEGLYQISTFGRVKSLARLGKGNRGESKILKAQTDNKGYLKGRFGKDGIGKGYAVHRLVSMAFIPNIENKPQVNHKDLDKKNNCVWNLEWNTNRENKTHSSLIRQSTSKYVGVDWAKKDKVWRARIRKGSLSYELGRYKDEIMAHDAYQKALKQINEGTFTFVKKIPPHK